MTTTRLTQALLLSFVLLLGTSKGQVHLQEYLINPVGGFFGGIDANGDGVVVGTEDEFVEVANLSSSTIDISGWTLADAAATRHTFASQTLLPPGSAIIVFGGGNLTWFNNQGHGLALTASTGSLDLSDAGDTIVLSDASGTVVQSQTYVSGGPHAAAGESVTRSPEGLFGTFMPHSTAPPGLLLHSAGKRNNGTNYLSPTLPPLVPLYPGNGSDVDIDIRVNGLVPFSTDGTFPVTTADQISMRFFSPMGSLVNASFLAAFEVIATSVTLPPVTLPGDPLAAVWLSPAIASVILNGLSNPNAPFSPKLIYGGFVLGPFGLPPHMAGAGTSIVLQTYTSDAGINAVNLGTSTAYRLIVQ